MNKDNGYMVVSVGELETLLRKARAKARKNYPGDRKMQKIDCAVIDLEIVPYKGQLQVQIPVRYTHGDASV